jgi:carnosine synthase
MHLFKWECVQIPLPAIMKLEYGSSSCGVKLVYEMEDAIEHLEFVQRNLQKEADHPGVGLGHGKTILLVQRLLGTEHDVDVVMYKGQLMAAFISDNGPTRLPLCMETSAVMPSCLPVGKSCSLNLHLKRGC